MNISPSILLKYCSNMFQSYKLGVLDGWFDEKFIGVHGVGLGEHERLVGEHFLGLVISLEGKLEAL